MTQKIDTLQAITDALGAIVLAMADQLDAKRLADHLQNSANEADAAGHGPSAGLIDELVRTLKTRVTQAN